MVLLSYGRRAWKKKDLHLQPIHLIFYPVLHGSRGPGGRRGGGGRGRGGGGGHTTGLGVRSGSASSRDAVFKVVYSKLESAPNLQSHVNVLLIVYKMNSAECRWKITSFFKLVNMCTLP